MLTEVTQVQRQGQVQSVLAPRHLPSSLNRGAVGAVIITAMSPSEQVARLREQIERANRVGNGRRRQ
jgi:hypothetical protein